MLSALVVVFASTTVNAQTQIPIRELSAASAKSADQFGAILGIREIADGRVLVNDGRRRQLVTVDSRLANKTVILDSVAVGGQSYGPRAAPMIPYLGDTTLFVDGTSRTLLVLGPSGAIARVASAPKPRDLSSLAYRQSGTDVNGNLIYMGSGPLRDDPRNPGASVRPDSEPVVRANFETRTVDTIARVRSRITSREESKLQVTGEYTFTQFVNPLPTFDEWAPLADGTVAIVRGQDYHVDFIRPDGSRLAGPKLPFDWKRLSEADKQALLDSARAAREAAERDPNVVTGPVSASAVTAAANGGPPVTKASALRITDKDVPLSEIVDYWPPLRQDAVKADADGNIWILPTTTAQSKNGELVYDVVNNRGVMTQRVRVPLGKAIAGFGKGGVVYLMYRDTTPGSAWTLERTTIVGWKAF